MSIDIFPIDPCTSSKGRSTYHNIHFVKWPWCYPILSSYYRWDEIKYREESILFIDIKKIDYCIIIIWLKQNKTKQKLIIIVSSALTHRGSSSICTSSNILTFSFNVWGFTWRLSNSTFPFHIPRFILSPFNPNKYSPNWDCRVETRMAFAILT